MKIGDYEAEGLYSARPTVGAVMCMCLGSSGQSYRDQRQAHGDITNIAESAPTQDRFSPAILLRRNGYQELSGF
jgi:hypothetical protein